MDIEIFNDYLSSDRLYYTPARIVISFQYSDGTWGSASLDLRELKEALDKLDED